jgi:hypothetical protein
MEQIKTQLDAALLDLRRAVDQGNQEPRPYAKKSENVYKPEQARFKLVVWFHDGNRRTYYSYDNHYSGKMPHLDEFEALIKLTRLCKKYAGKFKNAMIFATLDPDRRKDSNYNYLIYWAKWNGEIEANPAASPFKVQDKNVLLNLNRVEMYSPKNFVK